MYVLPRILSCLICTQVGYVPFEDMYYLSKSRVALVYVKLNK